MTIAPIIAVNALDLQQVNKLHQCIILTNKQKYKKSMLKHIVMWRYKDGAEGKSPLEHAQWMKQNLEALVGVVPEILGLEYGIDQMSTPASYHGVLTVVVEDAEALKRYANHPEHLKIVDYASRVTESRVVVDYTL